VQRLLERISVMDAGQATIQALSQALEKGALTSVALTEQMLERAQDRAGQGGAVYTRLFVNEALAQAHASDRLRAAGMRRSTIDGIPISVKDLFDVKGYTTRAGSKVLSDAKEADQDAVIVQRLRQAGAVIIGTTNMTEFAYSGLGINPHYGTPLSPWDRKNKRIPGGSSSGAAVAVSDAMAAASIGTDTGGSVRIPSAFCGLTGFKPSASRVDTRGALPLSEALDSIGPLARSVSCCYTLDAILAGQPAKPSLSAVSAKGLVLGLPQQMVMEGADETVRATFKDACDRLRVAGVSIELFDLPELDELAQINSLGGFTAAQAWAWHAALLQERSADYDPRVSARIKRGAAMTARDYIELIQARKDWIKRVTKRLKAIDALVMPTVPIVAPELQPLVDDDALYASTNILVLRNPSIINFLDGCALSLPCHQPGQAPVGLTVAGTHGEDERIFQIGLACESVLSLGAGSGRS
jgi:aspartyl-tRNA(Asn)/glutamyl-tRNA(Gln) amidotransferase subunit A